MGEEDKIAFERSWFKEAFSHADHGKVEDDIEYFGTSRIEAVAEKVNAIEAGQREISFTCKVKPIDGIDGSDEVIQSFESEDEEVNFLEEETLRHGME